MPSCRSFEASRGLDRAPTTSLDVLGHVLEVVEHARDWPTTAGVRSRAGRVRAVMAARWPTSCDPRRGLIWRRYVHDMASPPPAP